MKSSVFDNLFGYFLSFTKIYRSIDNPPLRDANILNLQLNHSLLPPTREDIIVGKTSSALITFNPQVSNGHPYFFQSDSVNRLLAKHKKNLSSSQSEKIAGAIRFWEHIFLDAPVRTHKFNAAPEYFPCEILPDLNLLLAEGLYQTKELTEASDCPPSVRQAKLLTITTINQVLDFYKYHTCALLTKYPNNRNINAVFDVLNWVKYRPPKTLLAQIQLYWLYAMVSCCDKSQVHKQLFKLCSESKDKSLTAETLMADIYGN